MEERKFKPRIKIVDDRKSQIQKKSATHAYDSPLAKAVRKHRDYKPPIKGKKK